MSSSAAFRRLLWLQLRMRLGLSVFRAAPSAHKQKTIRNLVLGALGFSVLLVYLTYLFYGLLASGFQAGLAEVFFGICFFLILSVCFLFGTGNLLTVVFNATDSLFYAALPISPSVTFFAKFAQVYLTELGLGALISIPFFVIYCLTQTVTAVFVISYILVVVVLPAISLGVASILAIPLLRLASTARRREIVQLVINFLMMGLYMAVVLGSSGQAATAEEVAAGAATFSDMLGLFPPAQWAGAAVSRPDGWGYLLLVLGIGLAALALAIGLAKPLYQRTILSQQETARSGRVRARKTVARSAAGALWRRELKTIVRTPSYLLNSGVTVVLYPILLAVSALMIPLAEIQKEMPDDAFFLFIFGYFTGMATLLLMMVQMAGTSISREGKQWALAYTLPVTLRYQLTVKQVFYTVIALLEAALMFVGFLLCCPYKEPVLWGGLLLLFVTPLFVATHLLADWFKPKLGWSSEAEAMKQNGSIFRGMFFSLIALAPPLAALLLLIGPLGLPAAVLLCGALSLAECAAASVLMRRRSPPEAV